MDALGFGLAFLSLVLLGIGTGAATGLAPGLHVNNVAAVVLATRASWVALLLGPWAGEDAGTLGLLLSCYLLATAVSHGVFDFVPSVFLGAPTEETALSILPGHRMLLAGEGARAVSLAARGAVLGAAFSAVVLIPLRWLLGSPVGLAEAFRPWSPYFLAAMLASMALTETRFARRRARRLARAVWVQTLAGLLGLAVLRGPSGLDPNVALFPLFSGLFGMPTLVVSLWTRPGEVPPQETASLPPLGRSDASQALRGSLAGAAVSWLPGLSGGAAATLAALGSSRKLPPSAFMVILGAVSTSTAVLSVSVLFMIGRTRSGVAAAVRDLLGDTGRWASPLALPPAVVWLLLASVLAAALAAPIASRLAGILAPRLVRWDPRLLSAATLVGLGVLILIATGPVGLAVAGLSCLVGSVPVRIGVRRIQLMAALLVPVLVGLSAV
ncbi:MAG TPA: tripartite tricarboxylate transporter permease [Thermoplasmata archaeon]|nr:tripartite tricarboxylate transporter permease [Thermoplasmata archaeon]